MKLNKKYKTATQNYNDCLKEARTWTVRQLEEELRDRSALHSWAIRAYEKALEEKRS